MSSRYPTLLALGLLAYSLIGLFMTRPELATLGIVILIIILIADDEPSARRSDSSRTASAYFGRSVPAVFGTLAAAIMCMNFLVNPFGIYPETTYSSIITLRSRRVKLDLYQASEPKPSFLVFGSSRSFTLPPETIEELTGRRAFNASVQGGNPRDYVGFLRFTIENGTPPVVVLVNLSVEQFLFGDNEDVIEPGEPLGAFMSDPAANLKDLLEDAKLLLSAEQTQASLRALTATVPEEQLPYFSFSSDGQGYFNIKVPIERAVREYLAGPWAPSMFDIERLSTTQIEHFRSFLQLARDHGIYVIVNLPPFHPTALEIYENDSEFAPREAEMMEMLHSLQDEFGYPINDFRRLSTFGGTADMFNDAVHPLERAYRLMLHEAIGRGIQ